MDLGEMQAALRAKRAGGGAGVGKPRLRVALGADHGGFPLKRALAGTLAELGWEVVDLGTHDTQPVDYPDFAVAVARAVASGDCSRGIIVDTIGVGSCMAANKVRGIRAATCWDEATARSSRAHNDANVMTLGAAALHPGFARRIMRVWLETGFDGGRHARRVDKIRALDGDRPA